MRTCDPSRNVAILQIGSADAGLSRWQSTAVGLSLIGAPLVGPSPDAGDGREAIAVPGNRRAAIRNLLCSLRARERLCHDITRKRDRRAPPRRPQEQETVASRSRAPRQQRARERERVRAAQQQVAAHRDRVLTFRQWCAVNNFSLATGRRLMKAGKARPLSSSRRAGSASKNPTTRVATVAGAMRGGSSKRRGPGHREHGEPRPEG